MSSTQNYAMWGEQIGNKYANVVTEDMYPFHNQWRGRPLSNQAWIRNNVAGFYPYQRMQRSIQFAPEPEWKYAWYYPCSTMFGSSPQFTEHREIILER
jgi:hypothetical protein